MTIKPTNVLRGAGLAILLAAGTGAARIVDGSQRLLQKVSRNLAVNIADLRTMADATQEEAMDDVSIAKDKR